MPAAKTILVVDDHPEHLYFFRRVLSEAGYTVLECGTGEEALARAVTDQPNLIILDLVLPAMSGWDASRALKEDPRTASIPIFLVTAYPHQASDRWSADGDCDALLVKPIDPRRMLAEVERWI